MSNIELPPGVDLSNSSGNWQQALVKWLKAQVGKRYQVGPQRFGPDYYDCSGLAKAAYQQLGVTGFGDWTGAQYKYGQTVGGGNLQIGDLVFSHPGGNSAPAGVPGHVAIYIGNGRIIQAASTKLGVIESNLDMNSVMLVKRIVGGDGKPVRSSDGLSASGQAAGGSVAVEDGVGNGDFPAIIPDEKGNTGGMYSNPDLVKRPTTEAEIKQYIQDNYGYMVGFMSDPELGPILSQAAREGLSKDMLYGRLSGTKWWKTHNDAQRKWQQIVNEDPATANAQRAAKRATLANSLGQLGLAMSAQDLDKIVEQSLASGLNPDQETDILLAYATPGPNGYTKGDLGATQQQIQALQAQFMIPRANGFGDVADMAKRVASGELTMDGIRANFANQSRSMFAGNDQMIDLINQGVSPYDALSGQRNAMANILEVDPQQIDMVNNAQYRKAIDTVGADGKHRIMTISEAEQLARDQSAFKNTVNGRRAFVQGSDLIAQYAGLK